MNSELYLITIKSANQKVDDYVTCCKSAWTVQRLKQHISETHVNKPNVEDQRLIYAGNILKDTQTLKQIFFRDSLCTELTNSSTTNFTIHLVCSQNLLKSSLPAQRNQQQSSTSNLQTTMHHDAARASTSVPSTSAYNYAGPAAGTSNSQTTGVHSSNQSLEQTYFPMNQQSAYSFDSNHASEIAQNLMQSDQMRNQFLAFQQLANMVAAQIAMNLTGTGQISVESGSQTEEIFTQYLHPASAVIEASQDLNHSPSINIQTSANDELLAATAAAAIARMRLTGDGTMLQSATQPIYLAQTNDTNIPDPNSQEPRGAGVTLYSSMNDRVSAANAQSNQPLNRDQDGVHGHQQVAAANVNMGHQLNFGVNRQMAQAQPIVEQPAAVVAPQVGDPEAQAMQHDVIDWVYYSIRAMILITALYIHASLTRLSFLAGALAIYYYFNRRSARRAAQQLQQQPAVPRVQFDGPQGEIHARNAMHRERNANGHQMVDIDAGVVLRRRRNVGGIGEGQGQDNEINGEERVDAQGDGQTPDLRGQRRVSFLKLCYLVITDFLASLVPE